MESQLKVSIIEHYNQLGVAVVSIREYKNNKIDWSKLTLGTKNFNLTVKHYKDLGYEIESKRAIK